ncbi:MAG TPA: FecR domain-containing protein [Cyclobacteriaceae bacterium]|nr:FecR domain-containing protein [Cyclobacteriaceae bacterium]
MDRRSQINDYLAGRLSAEEASELLQWINSAEGKRFLEDETEAVWDQEMMGDTDLGWDDQAVWEKIRSADRLGFNQPALKNKEKAVLVPAWLKWASSFVLFALIGYQLFSVYQRQYIDEGQPMAAADWVYRYNPPGQKSKIQLSDGSFIYLNADSKIEFAKDFTNNRYVKLEGEAYFSVAKDSLHPFVVESQGIQTRVLGTTFNISAFSTEDMVQVTLVSGKVELEKIGSSETIIMHPGEEMLLSQDENGFIKREVDVRRRISWTSGILEFEDAPFQQMIDILERWYGVEFKIHGTFPKALSSGTFGKDETLENVLDVLSSSIGFKYEIDNSHVTIDFM